MAAMLWNSRAKHILPGVFQKARLKDDSHLWEEHMCSAILLSQIKKLRLVEDTGPRSLVSGAELDQPCLMPAHASSPTPCFPTSGLDALRR